jgi:hypothetical protein
MVVMILTVDVEINLGWKRYGVSTNRLNTPIRFTVRSTCKMELVFSDLSAKVILG